MKDCCCRDGKKLCGVVVTDVMVRDCVTKTRRVVLFVTHVAVTDLFVVARDTRDGNRLCGVAYTCDRNRHVWCCS